MNDRLSFSRFVRLGMEDMTPDSTAVYRFRNILVDANMYDRILNEIKQKTGKMKLKSCIMYKGTKGRKITERKQRANASISKIRYRIERTFDSIQRWFLGGMVRNVGQAKTHAQHIMEAMAYNLYRPLGFIVSDSLK